MTFLQIRQPSNDPTLHSYCMLTSRNSASLVPLLVVLRSQIGHRRLCAVLGVNRHKIDMLLWQRLEGGGEVVVQKKLGHTSWRLTLSLVIFQRLALQHSCVPGARPLLARPLRLVTVIEAERCPCCSYSPNRSPGVARRQATLYTFDNVRLASSSKQRSQELKDTQTMYRPDAHINTDLPLIVRLRSVPSQIPRYMYTL